MRIIHSNDKLSRRSRITAADENVFDDFGDPGIDEDIELDDEAIGDQLDSLEDNIEDLQDSVDDVEEDDIDIEIDNNVTNHLIAECENCKKIFISAMIDSDQEVESISGICPCCGKDTVQQLKWIIKPYPEDSNII